MERLTVQILVSSGLLAAIGFISGCNAASFAPDAEAAVPVHEATITPALALLIPQQSLQFNATVNGAALANPIWLVDNVAGGTTSTGTITSSGLYTAPTLTPSTPIYVSVTDSDNDTRSTPVGISLFQTDHFQPGMVSASNNPQVALYTFAAPQGATVQIQFGTTTAYGLTTWAQPSPDGGGAVAMLVAGMRASTTYHMQALVHLANGVTVFDTDQVFTTGALPANLLPNLTVQQTQGMNPASGVELLCLFEEDSQTQLTAVVTDLAGNVIWYDPIQPNGPEPMKLLPNGHMLVLNTINAIQEIDLAGNLISQVSVSDLEQGLAAAGLSFPPLVSINHDVVKLPNGHLVMIVSFNETFTDQPGISTVEGNA